MDLKLTGSRAIVTGGSSGLGLAVARGLLAEGAKVALVARDPRKLEAAAEGLRAQGIDAGQVLIVAADTTDDAAVRGMVDRVVAAWGGVDVLVNAAAQPSFSTAPPTLETTSDAEVLADFDTKVLGYLRCARAVAPHMKRQDWGRIVNISGLNAVRTGSISGTIRNVSVAALTANLADELGPHGIGVTVVHPALVDTEHAGQLIAQRAAASGVSENEVRTEMGSSASLRRIMTASEVADVIVFLCSPRAVAVTGDAVSVAGGNRGVIHY